MNKNVERVICWIIYLIGSGMIIFPIKEVSSWILVLLGIMSVYGVGKYEGMKNL